MSLISIIKSSKFVDKLGKPSGRGFRQESKKFAIRAIGYAELKVRGQKKSVSSA